MNAQVEMNSTTPTTRHGTLYFRRGDYQDGDAVWNNIKNIVVGGVWVFYISRAGRVSYDVNQSAVLIPEVCAGGKPEIPARITILCRYPKRQEKNPYQEEAFHIQRGLAINENFLGDGLCSG